MAAKRGAGLSERETKTVETLGGSAGRGAGQTA